MKNPKPSGNDLLARLQPSELVRIFPYVEEIELETGHVLFEPGDKVQNIYFPREQSLVAFRVPMKDGDAVEVALVGREGAVGGITSHGDLPAYVRCCVHNGGPFYRISCARFEAIRAASPEIARLFAHYADAFLAELFQAAACNARHSIEQRVARWLCTVADRLGHVDIKLTQADLGSLLGVGRSYVARVMARLKDAGILDIARGHTLIRNPARLHAMSCECSALVDDHFQLVMRRLRAG
jgi:CRP-like cAMP-binding protein